MSPALPRALADRVGRMPRLLALGLALSAVAPVSGFTGLRAQTAGPYAEAARSEQFRSAIEEARAMAVERRLRGGIPGMAVAVGVDGEVVWAEGFGYASVEHRAPVWPTTKFRIGSVSKPLTSVAVALLRERGELDLDAPVQRYVPSFPEKRWPVTTRLLMGHLAGVRHYRDEEFLSKKPYETVEEGLAIFEEDTLLFEPGSEYSYSSYGWNLVSAVVEGASGRDFLGSMRRQVLDPLGLDQTVADHPDSIVFRRTEFYVRGDDARLRNATYVDNSYKWAGGGYLSTAPDLVRLGLALANDRLLEPATIDTLWTSLRTDDGEETGYGLGWSVAEDDEGRRVVGHGGGSVGGTTHFVIYPEHDVVAVVVSNLSSADLGEGGARAYADLFLDALAAERKAGPSRTPGTAREDGTGGDPGPADAGTGTEGSGPAVSGRSVPPRIPAAVRRPPPGRPSLPPGSALRR